MQFANTKTPRKLDRRTKTCVDCGERIRYDVKYRCRECFLKLEDRPAQVRIPRPDLLFDQQQTEEWFRTQDARFCIAMQRAGYGRTC